ncbi:MAG: carbon monoxide dehydrogenase, partial [Acidimicrobiales bacterium]
FKEMDEVAHRAVLEAEGRETRGQGNASALITATLSASDVGTKVQVNTELSITGKVAQFGRGVLADVSGKLLDQFVHNLETMVLAPAASAATNEPAEPASKTPEAKAPAARAKAEPKPKAKSQAAASSDGAGHVDEVEAKPETAPPTVRQIQSAPAEPVDLVGIAGPSLARRVLPFASIAGAFFLVRIIVYALRRRRS